MGFPAATLTLGREARFQVPRSNPSSALTLFIPGHDPG